MRNNVNLIKIISINVGRSSTAHEIALETAFKTKIDFVLVQEPCISQDLSKKITRNHPSFECFTPTDDWTQRPRVLTYSRKNNFFKISQTRPIHTSEQGAEDVLFLIIKTIGSSRFKLLKFTTLLQDALIQVLEYLSYNLYQLITFYKRQ